MEYILRRLRESHLKESINFRSLESELKSAVHNFMVNKGGFPEDEADDYTKVEINQTPNGTVVEVRAELSYRSMMKLSDVLDPIVAKYDENAYFDAEDAGIITAFLSSGLNEARD